MAVLSGLALTVVVFLPQEGETSRQEEDPALLRQELERQQREMDALRARLEAVEASPRSELGQKSLLDELRINVYSNIIGQTDDQLVFDEQGREIQDRIRVRQTDFDFRAPLGRNADAVVIAALVADPVSDYDGELEQAFARIRLFVDEDWETQLIGGKFRSRFGRNNRLRVFELPQPTRPLVVTEFLGQDGYLATGGSIIVNVPTGADQHTLAFTFEGVNSGDLRVGDEPGDEPIAGMLNLDWTWACSSTLTVDTGLSGYFSRGGDDLLGGADLLFSWETDDATPRAYHLGAEVMTADPELGDDAFGGYAWVQAQLSTDWFAGLRYDYVERLANSAVDVTQGGVYVSWFFSNHLRISTGYEHSEGDQGFVDGANHVYLEGNVFLGADPLIPFWAGRDR